MVLYFDIWDTRLGSDAPMMLMSVSFLLMYPFNHVLLLLPLNFSLDSTPTISLPLPLVLGIGIYSMKVHDVVAAGIHRLPETFANLHIICPLGLLGAQHEFAHCHHKSHPWATTISCALPSQGGSSIVAWEKGSGMGQGVANGLDCTLGMPVFRGVKVRIRGEFR